MAAAAPVIHSRLHRDNLRIEAGIELQHDGDLTLGALDLVRRFVERYPEHVGWAAGRFVLGLRESGFQFGAVGVSEMPAAEMLHRLLLILHESLQSSLPAKRGAFLHRFQEGGLVFEQPRDEQDRGLDDPVLTTLMFQLVYLFRRFTAGATARHGRSRPESPAAGKKAMWTR